MSLTPQLQLGFCVASPAWLLVMPIYPQGMPPVTPLFPLYLREASFHTHTHTGLCLNTLLYTLTDVVLAALGAHPALQTAYSLHLWVRFFLAYHFCRHCLHTLQSCYLAVRGRVFGLFCLQAWRWPGYSWGWGLAWLASTQGIHGLGWGKLDLPSPLAN